jgi:hypothetical protein
MGLVKPSDLIGNRRTRSILSAGFGLIFLICLCRESVRGWLKTIRFVKHSIEHGTEPKIFWGLI